jgi:hypothetical protein
MKFTFRKRVFLNHISTSTTSYIFVEAESSQNGAYKFGNYIVRIADCETSVFFEFYLGSKQARRLSLAKIDRLIKTLTTFRDQLRREAKLIEEYREPHNMKKS